MRRLPLIPAAATVLLLGCRAPSIPAQPTHSEYVVYSAYLQQASSITQPPLSFTIDAETLSPRRDELQFQQCLPRRMETVFDHAPSAILTSTSGNEWLTLADGRTANLRPPGTPPIFERPTEWFRLSRVAFTYTAYDAYLWVEHQTCGTTGTGCAEGSGTLVHGKESGGAWTFEETICETVVPAT